MSNDKFCWDHGITQEQTQRRERQSLISKISTLEGKVKELEQRPRNHICIWCREILYSKTLGETPTDEETQRIADHIMNCKENPVVVRAKQAESQIKELEKEITTHEDLELNLAEGKHKNWLDWQQAESRLKRLQEAVDLVIGFISEEFEISLRFNQVMTQLKNVRDEK